MLDAEILIACPKNKRHAGHDFLGDAEKLSEVLIEHYDYTLDVPTCDDCFILLPPDGCFRVLVSGACDFIHKKISEYSKPDRSEINRSIIFTSNESQCYLEALYSHIKFSKKIFISSHTKITVLTRNDPYVVVDNTINKRRFVHKVYVSNLGINKLYVREEEAGSTWPYPIKKRFMFDLIEEHSHFLKESVYIVHSGNSDKAEEFESKINIHIPSADVKNRDFLRNNSLFKHLYKTPDSVEQDRPKVIIFILSMELLESCDFFDYFCESIQAGNAIVVDTQSSSLNSTVFSDIITDKILNRPINSALSRVVSSTTSQVGSPELLLSSVLRDDVFFTISEESKIIARTCQLCAEKLKSYTTTGGIDYREGGKVIDVLKKKAANGSVINFHRSEGVYNIHSY